MLIFTDYRNIGTAMSDTITEEFEVLPQNVEAVRVAEDSDLDELVEWVQCRNGEAETEGTSLIVRNVRKSLPAQIQNITTSVNPEIRPKYAIRGGDGGKTANVGDWIVLNERGLFEVISDEQFRERYA